MFAIHCKSCERHVLLGSHAIIGMENNAGCIQVTYRCICDHIDTWITGHQQSEATA